MSTSSSNLIRNSACSTTETRPRRQAVWYWSRFVRIRSANLMLWSRAVTFILPWNCRLRSTLTLIKVLGSYVLDTEKPGHGWLEGQMISGAHVIVYSKNAEADRAFFRDVLGFKSVDAGHGWLIFALPPGEAAVHPSDDSGAHELYFMCDDLKAEMASLAKKGVKCSEVLEPRWGSITKMRLPGGGEVGLYQPKHPTAVALK